MLHANEIINIAKGLVKSNNYIEAESVLLEALQASPEDQMVRGMLADVYIKMNRLDSALENAEHILKKDPANVYALQKKATYSLKGERLKTPSISLWIFISGAMRAIFSLKGSAGFIIF